MNDARYSIEKSGYTEQLHKIIGIFVPHKFQASYFFSRFQDQIPNKTCLLLSNLFSENKSYILQWSDTQM